MKYHQLRYSSIIIFYKRPLQFFLQGRKPGAHCLDGVDRLFTEENGGMDIFLF